MRVKVATLAAVLVLALQTACFAGAGANGGSGSSTTTVDLGTIGSGTNVNASIVNHDYANQIETYTYQQLLFLGSNLGLVLDSGQTVAEVLAQDLGQANNGTLDYNFPFTYGASGSYSQNGSTTPNGSNNISITATSVSGHVYNGHNNVGATISVNPIDAASTYDNILGGRGTQINNGFPTSTTTTVTLQLGTVSTAGQTITIGGQQFATDTNVEVIEGEDSTTTWTSTGSITLSPIVLDLSGTGKLDACEGNWHSHKGFLGKRLAFFDFDGTGYDLLMEWVGPHAGLLVQPKADGSVDGTCLFGTVGGYNNGFEKLAVLDKNNDGVLTGKELDGLMVWIDTKADGYCDKSELHSLKELGITSISVKHSKDFAGTFTMNGKTEKLWDWWPNALNMRRMRVASK
jgi:hypothetical protein